MNQLQKIEAFLKAFGDDVFVFQTFSDSKQAIQGKSKDPLARVFVGTLREHYPALLELNRKGAGVYFQINTGLGRGKKYIKKIRVLFMDCDNITYQKEIQTKIKHFLPEPTLIVQSSQGKRHYYWVVTNCSLQQWPAKQLELAKRFNTDTAMKNLDRVARLPGFDHCKDPENRQPVELLSIKQKRYTVEEVFAKLNGVPYSDTRSIPLQGIPKPPPDANPFGLDNYQPSENLKEIYYESHRTQGLVAEIGRMEALRLYAQEKDEAQAIREKVIEINKTRCNPPLDDAELESQVLPAIKNFLSRRNEDFKPLPPPIITTRIPPPPPQIQDVSDELSDWMVRYVFIAEGSEVADLQDRGRFRCMKLADFKNLTANKFHRGSKLMFTAWMQSGTRLSARAKDYKPGANIVYTDVSGNMVNTYSAPTFPHVDNVDMTLLEPFFRHMVYMFPNERDRKIFMDWLVCTVQKPWVKIQWAPLLFSRKHGIGKSYFFNLLRKLCGQQNCKSIDAGDLDSMKYDDFKADCTVVWVHEIHTQRRYSVTEKLKTCITETYNDVNVKYGTKGQRELYANYGFSTNHGDAIVIPDNDRRWWVYEKVGPPADNAHYWGNNQQEGIVDFLENDLAIAHLHKYFMEYDLTGFNPGEAPPMTDAKRNMIRDAKSQFEVILEDAIEHKDGTFAADVISLKQVYAYIENKDNCTLGDKNRSQVRAIWNRVSEPLPSDRNYVAAKGDKSRNRHKVRAVRNVDFWRTVKTADICYEYTRATQFARGSKEILPPLFKEIGA